jgi:hypothetical protein
MDPDNLESPPEATPPTETISSAPSGGEPVPVEDPPSPDPAALVNKLVVAGEWPEPELLEKIVEAGDAAVEPLISVLRTYPRGWPAEAPLSHAMALLRELRPLAAIPELIEIIKRYDGDSADEASRVLGSYGAIAFEPLLELTRDPSVTGYNRSYAINAARQAAGDDPARKARLADVIRPYLAAVIERGREEMRLARLDEDLEESEEDAAESAWGDLEDEDEGEEPSDEEGLEAPGDVPAFDAEGTHQLETEAKTDADDSASASKPSADQKQSRLDTFGEITFLVNDLAALADPLARELIKTAFAEELVETFWITEADVDALYRDGGEPPQPDHDWLSNYRARYQRHFDQLNRPATPPPMRSDHRPSKSVERDQPPILADGTPIRNIGPRLGRNDLCWCGSGKKYKKCHRGKDALT